MVLKEEQIRESIVDYLEKENYLVVKEYEINGIKADIAAFKWKNDFEIEAIAVECKGGTNINRFIEAALEQAREYQTAFPNVYLRIPAIKEKKPRKDEKNNPQRQLIEVLNKFRIGIFTVDNNKKVDRLSKADFSLRLKEEDYFLKVRQRAVALWCFKSIGINFNQIKIKYNPYGLACWTVEQANYLITNEEIQTERNYHFGINVENVKNIKKSIIESNPENLYQIIKNLSEGYILRVDYTHTYKPRLVYHPLFIKQVNEIKIDDIKRVIDYCKEIKGKARIFISKKVWDLYEALRKEEHLERIKKIKEETKELRSYLLNHREY